MMRKLLIDENVESSFREVTSTTDAHIGLLIGRVTGNDKGYVLRAIPTPVEDEDEQGHQAQSFETASQDWVAEHAKQVSGMLVGGLGVIGVYSVGPKADATQLQRLGVLALGLNELVFQGKPQQLEKLCYLLAINTQPFRFSSKCFDLTSDSKLSAMQAVDVKGNQQNISKFVCFSCNYELDSFLALKDGSTGAEGLKTSLASVVQGIQDSFWSINGETNGEAQASLVTMDSCALTGFPGTKVELYSPGVGLPDEILSPAHYKETQLRGTLVSAALVHETESIEVAIQALKNDICRSLETRISVLFEDVDEITSELKEGLTQIPLRVFLPCADQASLHCDYVIDKSDLNNSVLSFSEILQIEVDVGIFSCPEKYLDEDPELHESVQTMSQLAKSQQESSVSREDNQNIDETKKKPASSTLNLIILNLLVILSCIVIYNVVLFPQNSIEDISLPPKEVVEINPEEVYQEEL
mmetsp:Transcript_34862/g.44724  ORF Transcript_34862/g.44724 Transcript_34862/m.44724 type:complete len:470 (+) Transcript_34862:298-1707(+)